MDVFLDLLAPVLAATGVVAVVMRLLIDSRPVRVSGWDGVNVAPRLVAGPEPRREASVGHFARRSPPGYATRNALAPSISYASLFEKNDVG